MVSRWVADFHTARRMFAVIGGEVRLAPGHSAESHPDWFAREGWIQSADDPAFADIVRGYGDGRDIYAYRGRDFRGDALVEETMRRHAEEIRRTLHLPDTARVFIGVKIGEPGKVWPPLRVLKL